MGLLTHLMWKHINTKYGDRISRDLIRVDEIFAPAYGIDRSGERLTQLSLVSTQVSVRGFYELGARHLIMSHAHPEIAELEKEFKLKLIGDTVSDTEILHIRMIESSNSIVEVNKFLEYVAELGIKTVGIVGEVTHLPRILRQLFLLNSEIEVLPIEFQGEPMPYMSKPWYKGYSNHNLLWEIWNFVFYFLTPLLIKAREK